MRTMVNQKGSLVIKMKHKEALGFVLGVFFIFGIFVYQLENTNVEIWQPTPDSEEYMEKGK